MATKYSIKETSFRIGSGRYLQGSDILGVVAEEAETCYDSGSCKRNWF